MLGTVTSNHQARYFDGGRGTSEVGVGTSESQAIRSKPQGIKIKSQ